MRYAEKERVGMLGCDFSSFSCWEQFVFSVGECAGPAKSQSMLGLSKAALFELWIK